MNSGTSKSPSEFRFSRIFWLTISFNFQVYALIVIYLFTCLLASYVLAMITVPGHPEKIATATGNLKLNFQKQETKGMSNTLK